MTKKILSFVLAAMLVFGCAAAFAEKPASPTHSTNKHSMYELSASAKLTYTVGNVFEWTVPEKVEIEFTAADKSLPYGYVSVRNVILGAQGEEVKDIMITISYDKHTDLTMYPIGSYVNAAAEKTMTVEDYEAAEDEDKEGFTPVYDKEADPVSVISAADWHLYTEMFTAAKDEETSKYTYDTESLVCGVSPLVLTETPYRYNLDDEGAEPILLVVRTNGADKLLRLEYCVDDETKEKIEATLTVFDEENDYYFAEAPSEVVAEDLYYTNRGVPQAIGYHEGTVTYTCVCNSEVDPIVLPD